MRADEEEQMEYKGQVIIEPQEKKAFIDMAEYTLFK